MPSTMLVESDKNLLWVAFKLSFVGPKVPWAFLWLGEDGRVFDTMQVDLKDATTPRVLRDATGTLRAFSYEGDSHGTGGGYTMWSLVEFPSETDGGSTKRARDTSPQLVERGAIEAWMSEPLMKRLCLRQHPRPPSGDNEGATLEYDLKYELVVADTGLGVWRSGTVRCEEKGRASRSVSISDLLLLDENSGKWEPAF